MPAIPRLDELPDILTAKQVARFLQITENHAYELAARGQIPAIKFSRRCVRFPKEGLRKLLNAQTA